MVIGAPLAFLKMPCWFGWLGRRRRRRGPEIAGLRLMLGQQISRFSRFPGQERFPMFLLQDDQQVPLSIQPVDKMGEPTSLPAGATAVWSSSDPSIVAVTADPNNPLAAVAASVGAAGSVKLGTAQVNVVVIDPSAPAGSPGLSAAFDVQVVAGVTAGIQIVPGSPSSRV